MLNEPIELDYIRGDELLKKLEATHRVKGKELRGKKHNGGEFDFEYSVRISLGRDSSSYCLGNIYVHHETRTLVFEPWAYNLELTEESDQLRRAFDDLEFILGEHKVM